MCISYPVSVINILFHSYGKIPKNSLVYTSVLGNVELETIGSAFKQLYVTPENVDRKTVMLFHSRVMQTIDDRR